MAEQCFTCSAMAHGISVAKLHRQSLRLLTLAQAVRKRRVQRAAAVFPSIPAFQLTHLLAFAFAAFLQLPIPRMPD